MHEQEHSGDDLPTILPPQEYLAQIMVSRGSEVDRTAREGHVLLSVARTLVRARQTEQFFRDLEASGLDIETYFKGHPETIEGFRRLGLIE